MNQKKEVLIFTDLDGSLLNNETFKFDEIKNFLLKCLNNGIKLIPTSSKTDLEIQQFINELNYNIPYISENGSSIHNLDILKPDISKKIILARPLAEIQKIFIENINTKLLSYCSLLSEMDIEKQTKILGLSKKKLKASMNRNYTFLINFNGGKEAIEQLNIACNKLGLAINQGGRVFSVGDNVNKSIAVKKTLNVLSNYQDFKDVITIGIGDSPNDLEMLEYVDFPCLIKNKNNQNLLNKDKYTISTKEAPLGWMEVVKMALEKIH